jgi:hypothetical protein
MTPRAVELALIDLDKIGKTDQLKIEIINQSIMKGWTSLYPLNGGQAASLKKAGNIGNFEGRDYTKADYETMYEDVSRFTEGEAKQ